MRQIVEVDVDKDSIIITKIFHIDETIFDGFYFTMITKKVKANIKSFGIKKRQAKTYDDIGVQYSKRRNRVIITFNIKQPNINFYGQFLIHEKVNELDIMNCEHPTVYGLKSILISGLGLAKSQTINDVMKIERPIWG